MLVNSWAKSAYQIFHILESLKYDFLTFSIFVITFLSLVGFHWFQHHSVMIMHTRVALWISKVPRLLRLGVGRKLHSKTWSIQLLPDCRLRLIRMVDRPDIDNNHCLAIAKLIQTITTEIWRCNVTLWKKYETFETQFIWRYDGLDVLARIC